MKAITKKEIREFLKSKLSTDKAWAIRAMSRIYDYQTETEKNYHDTIDRNYVGFSGADAKILTSIYDYYKNHGYVSPKQLAIVYKKIPKYWNQIYTISDKSKLDPMISEYTSSVKRMY